MKIHYKKQKAKAIQYRNYKHFHEQSFNFELNNELPKISINNAELKEFNQTFFKKFLINLPNVDYPILNVKMIRVFQEFKSCIKEKDLHFSFKFADKPKISKEISKLD